MTKNNHHIASPCAEYYTKFNGEKIFDVKFYESHEQNFLSRLMSHTKYLEIQLTQWYIILYSFRVNHLLLA